MHCGRSNFQNSPNTTAPCSESKKISAREAVPRITKNSQGVRERTDKPTTETQNPGLRQDKSPNQYNMSGIAGIRFLSPAVYENNQTPNSKLGYPRNQGM